jgi:arginine deiminase
MILNAQTVIIGLSQRTEMKAIEAVANNLFKDERTSFNKIVVIDLPKTRAFMHLDTVFTNIDYDKFIVHSLIFDYLSEFKIWEITKESKVKINLDFESYLSKLMNKKVTLIKCGGNDPIAAGREQ